MPFVFLQFLIFTTIQVAMNDISAPEQYDLQTAALKVPPHSIEAEQAVLGGLMLDNNAWERVLDQVSDGDFYRHDHRLIFRAIAKLADLNSPIDVVTLAEQLDKEGQTSQVGASVTSANSQKTRRPSRTSRPMPRSSARGPPCAN